MLLVLGSREGSHWSLLIYEKRSNTWFHMDSSGSVNTPHAKQIRDRVDKCLVKQGNHAHSNTSYIESQCTQQKNGYDCGPLTILFAMSTAKKIARGEPLQACWVREYEAYGIRRWIQAELNETLLDLEKGRVRTRDTINHGGRSAEVKSKNICWFYKHRTCRFGVNCTYWHPPGVRQKERRDTYRDNNRYTKNHQYTQRNYPNDNYKHNQNTHFLENRRNPKNWPTSMEMDQAIKLIRFLQVGSSSRGPARR